MQLQGLIVIPVIRKLPLMTISSWGRVAGLSLFELDGGFCSN